MRTPINSRRGASAPHVGGTFQLRAPVGSGRARPRRWLPSWLPAPPVDDIACPDDEVASAVVPDRTDTQRSEARQVDQLRAIRDEAEFVTHCAAAT